MYPDTSNRSRAAACIALAALQLYIVDAATHMEIARSGAMVLQESWYDGNSGLYNTTGWWNAANAITTLADMTAVDPNILDRTSHQIFNNTFNRAQQSNIGVLKLNATYECDGIRNKCQVQDIKTYSKEGWMNNYFDDEGWWALAWIAVWDVTQDALYLDTATDIFNDMVSQGLNGTCGGIWWDKTHTQINAIPAELFISVAAHLANRKPNGDYYLAWAKKHWQWFLDSGLINERGTINDALDLATCKNRKDAVWSYNQGVILGALVELHRAERSNRAYISKAVKIADAALADPKLVDSTGILHDLGEPDLGGSGSSFKGIFVRNLGILNTVVRKDSYKKFIQKQADSIMTKNQNGYGQFGPVWDKLNEDSLNAATHASALDALVAASTLKAGLGGYIGAF